VGSRFSAPVQTGPGAHPAFCTMSTGSFPVVKSGRGVTLTPHRLLVPWSWKGRAIYTSTPPMGRTACTEPQCLYTASVPVHSLSACTQPQCLCTASVPVHSLGACTQPRFLYTASVPVHSLSSCTQPQFLYTASVPVHSLSACTQPQCLYTASVPVHKGALYLYLYL
jgi:hypothetical protein